MNGNREEAVRARGRAEEQMHGGDYFGARNSALKAMRLVPDLDNLLHILTVCNVHCSSRLPSAAPLPDWYGILGTDRTADESVFRKQYRKLALLLHPDKNQFPGAEAAFKLVGEANLLLSDPLRRTTYDSVIAPHLVRGGPHTPPPPQAAADKPSILLTRCPFCSFSFHIHRCFLNVVLRCHTCSKPFTARDCLAPTPSAAQPPRRCPDARPHLPEDETVRSPVSDSNRSGRDSDPIRPPPAENPTGAKRKEDGAEGDISGLGKPPPDNGRNTFPAGEKPAQPPRRYPDIRRQLPEDEPAHFPVSDSNHYDLDPGPTRPSPVEKPPEGAKRRDDGAEDDMGLLGKLRAGQKPAESSAGKPPAVKKQAGSCSRENGGKEVTPFGKPPPAVKKRTGSSWSEEDGGKDGISPARNLPPAVKNPRGSWSEENGGKDGIIPLRKPRSAVKRRPGSCSADNGGKDVSHVGKPPAVKKPTGSWSDENGGIRPVRKPPAAVKNPTLSGSKRRPPAGKDDIRPVGRPPAVRKWRRSCSDGNGGEDDIRPAGKPPAVRKRRRRPRPCRDENDGKGDISPLGKPSSVRKRSRRPCSDENDGKGDIAPVGKPSSVRKRRSCSGENDGKVDISPKQDDIGTVGKRPAVGKGGIGPVGRPPAVEKSAEESAGGGDDITSTGGSEGEGRADESRGGRGGDGWRKIRAQTVFHDFSTGRTEEKFKAGQVWAVMRGAGGRRRRPRYVRVEEVEASAGGFRVRAAELGVGVGPSSCCGVFWAGRGAGTELLDASDFSHLVEAVPAGEGRYDIRPRKGDVWAFQKGSGGREVWRVVEVRGSFGDELKVRPLQRVRPGRSVFNARIPVDLMAVQEEDMWRFSHQIPAFRLDLKPESLGRCWELDPAALPDCD